MTDAEKVNLELNIGGVRIPLSVDKTKITAVRETEQELRELYDTWRERFPSKTSHQLLAMMAYQYAVYYRELEDRYQAASNAAGSLEYAIDSLLGKVDRILESDPPVRS